MLALSLLLASTAVEGSFIIQFAGNTGKCLDLPGGNTANGNLLQIWDCNGHDNQNWDFDAGSWQIKSARDPKKCVDLDGGNLKDGNRLQLWDCNGHTNQFWGYDTQMRTIYLKDSTDAGPWSAGASAGQGNLSRPLASKCVDLAGGNTNNGNSIQIWDCNGLSNQKWAIATPGTAVYDVPFQDDTYLSRFALNFDWSQHNPAGQAAHFSIQNNPAGPGKALRIFLGQNDKPFKEGDSTFPRSELSGHSTPLYDNVVYSATWDVYLQEYTEGYWFCFAQVFGDGHPNVMLRWETGHYSIWSNEKHVDLPGNVDEDLRQWVTWSLYFKLSSSGGYVKVYRNGVYQNEIDGNTAGGGQSYWKQGIYTQHVNSVKDTTMYIRNLKLTRVAEQDIVV